MSFYLLTDPAGRKRAADDDHDDEHDEHERHRAGKRGSRSDLVARLAGQAIAHPLEEPGEGGDGLGVYVFARALVSAGEIPEIVGWVAIIDAMVTMLFGFLMYLPQKDMKRLLAFSTIAQLSYVFFGLGLSVFGSQLAFDGAVCHIFNHAFAKTLFFLIAGSFSFTLGTRMLPKLRGIVKKYPISGVATVSATMMHTSTRIATLPAPTEKPPAIIWNFEKNVFIIMVIVSGPLSASWIG